MSGQRVDACDLRGQIDWRGAHLSRVILTGQLGDIDAGECPVCELGTEAACNALDFRRANLSGADLTGVTGARDARFEQTDLSLADFTGAQLRGAVFSGANLSQAIMVGVDLVDADLRGARLSGLI